jgi:glycosyltransferase involved in cell wall biosynthesis
MYFYAVKDFKVSLITVCYNAKSTIQRCIESVLTQSHLNTEYIIIDGGSTDGTIQIIEQYRSNISLFISEPDKGIYDAMNKGINLANGDVIGTLNADDVLGNSEVLKTIASTFEQTQPDIVYGDLQYVNLNGMLVRRWNSKKYKQGAFNWGWMPPHPAFYCKRQLFHNFGLYNLEYGTAGDYELMLRFMHLNKLNVVHLNKVLVKMSVGGISNRSLTNRARAWYFDFKAMKKNGVLFPPLAIILKPVRKISQYI